MKKLLIASTALVATSGFAAAEVTLSGSAQFGVIYEEDRTNPDLTTGISRSLNPAFDPTQPVGPGNSPIIITDNGPRGTVDDELYLDYELQFDLSGSTTTDSGLTFGATADFEADSNRFGDSAEAGFDPEIFVSGGFGVLTIGDIDVATDTAFGGKTRDPGYDGIGIDNKIDTLIFADAGAGFDIDELTIDSNIRYEFATGGFGLVVTGDSFEENYAVALTYDFGQFDIGVGYVDIEDYGVNVNSDALNPNGGGDSWSVFFGGEIAGFDFDIYYVDHENEAVNGPTALRDAEAEGYGFSGGYDMGGYTILFAANYVELENVNGFNNTNSVDGWDYGIGVSYDLGGGASLDAGIGQIWQIDDSGPRTTDDDKLVASLGMTFSF